MHEYKIWFMLYGRKSRPNDCPNIKYGMTTLPAGEQRCGCNESRPGLGETGVFL